MWPPQGWEQRVLCEPASRRCCRPRLCLSPWSKFTQGLFIWNTKSLCTVSHHQKCQYTCVHPYVVWNSNGHINPLAGNKRCPKIRLIRKFPVLKDGFLSDCMFPFKLHYFLVVYELSCLASLFLKNAKKWLEQSKEFWIPLSALPLPHTSVGWSCSLGRHQRPPLYLFSGFWFATWWVLCIRLTTLEIEY